MSAETHPRRRIFEPCDGPTRTQTDIEKLERYAQWFRDVSGRDRLNEIDLAVMEIRRWRRENSRDAPEVIRAQKATVG